MGSILLIWTNNMAKIQSMLRVYGWSYEWWGAWAKQSSENGWATKSTFVKSSDVPKQKGSEAEWAN
jgi:hypothetical protein